MSYITSAFDDPRDDTRVLAAVKALAYARPRFRGAKGLDPGSARAGFAHVVERRSRHRSGRQVEAWPRLRLQLRRVTPAAGFV